MKLIKTACMSLVIVFCGNICATESSLPFGIEQINAGGAAGQRAQCPYCNNWYLVGTHHRCPPKTK